MTVKEIRQLSGLSQGNFCEKYHIPKSSLENWEQGKREAPPYLLELLQFRVEYDVKNESK